jgi:hypothetical protein
MRDGDRGDDVCLHPFHNDDRDPERPYYPEVTVVLIGEDSNAGSIIGRVTRALKRAGLSEGVCAAFRREAMSGDYDNVIQTAMRWVDVE